MLIENVHVGDIIKEAGNKKGIAVTKVEPYACSSKGTHINGKYCYDRGTQVQVSREIDIDNNVFIDELIETRMKALEYETMDFDQISELVKSN